MEKNTYLPLIVGLSVLGFIGYLAWNYAHVLSSGDNLMDLVRYLALSLFIAPAILAYRSSSHFLKHLSIWLCIGLGLAIAYTYQGELKSIWGRLSGQFSPSTGAEAPDGSVSYVRSSDGHFHIDALVNGVLIRFMVDTGASRVSFSESDAKRLSINVETLSYDMLSQTANGTVFTAPVSLPIIKIGPIEVRDVAASVNRHLGGQSLLGMSFLNKLKKFTIEGDRLTLSN